MITSLDRRQFLQGTAALAASALLPQFALSAEKKPLYQISLAQWSLHKAIFDKKMDNLDFAKVAKTEFDISAIEYVNQFFFEKAKDESYLADMKKRAEDQGVQSLLIMVDREGQLGDPDKNKRSQTVDNHKKWVEAAKFLGCHSIRVNAASRGSYDEQIEYAADGLAQLTDFAKPLGLNILVENHGGLSSNAAWLSTVMERVDDPHCGTLPDFGNFRISDDNWYDRYQGVEELMPFAHAVSAKSYDFDDNGNDTRTDFLKIMKIVLDAGYRGFVGIEYEGHQLDEYAGIRATKKLLEKVRDELAGDYA
ncbi:Xylose isomerase-like TIM barrel [Thalassoglobus neptunius]|uniref:Xylose isomerase-like TIM barrel n=1 Tax=Thalassoglobus neptunius TaxID=1938619 RepID=A0A5C5WLG7_9PLAN|nr:sugar phosphate isomerase/epimerase family protein [Thalassoglobus neptunius]TWT51520.1 Xylose isomerase-like TIM barrel [Thalassoglobus neptunius]